MGRGHQCTERPRAHRRARVASARSRRPSAPWSREYLLSGTLPGRSADLCFRRWTPTPRSWATEPDPEGGRGSHLEAMLSAAVNSSCSGRSCVGSRLASSLMLETCCTRVRVPYKDINSYEIRFRFPLSCSSCSALPWNPTKMSVPYFRAFLQKFYFHGKLTLEAM